MESTFLRRVEQLSKVARRYAEARVSMDEGPMRVVLEGELSGNPHPVVNSSLDEKTEVPGQIKSEWLGAEACVHLPTRTPKGNRFLVWSRLASLRLLLNSFSAGLTMGIALAWFACDQFGRRRRRQGRVETNGERGPALRVPSEVASCLD